MKHEVNEQDMKDSILVLSMIRVNLFNQRHQRSIHSKPKSKQR